MTHRALCSLLLVAMLCSGCTPSSPALTPAPTAIRGPAPTPTPVPPTPTPAPLRVWLDSSVPLAVRDPVSKALQDQATAPAASANAADLIISLDGPVSIASWVYAVVVPFPTLADEVAWDDVLRFWSGESGALSNLSSDGRTPTLYVTPETLGTLFGLLGPCAASSPLTVVSPEELVDRLWKARPRSWAIVPFDELEPRLKVLSVEGVDVLDKRADLAQYPLALRFGAVGKGAEELASAVLGSSQVLTNRDTSRMTELLMTGVTALTRNTAIKMEQNGVLYPGERIREILRRADITHISNEVSFMPECPQPRKGTMTFCSSPAYFDLLKDVGVDVVELTGNHLNDYVASYGWAPLHNTLTLLREEGWPYFGGGENLEDARRPLLLTSNQNRLGFAGCNWWGPDYAWAGTESPGAAPCATAADMELMRQVVSDTAQSVDVSVFTFQYLEIDEYQPTAQQRVDFRAMIDAGADIVSGSQAHQPQAYEFYHGGMIHYGLGNLFFDQMQALGYRQELADRHIIYAGRHISTEVLTFMLEDYCQPRPMTREERSVLLKTIFQASGW
ncbi:MAG: Capsule biosynthesis protein CapA [Chloroflexi bacterium ADurb.Bin180]|nr:MAG: Capsule biosynthesis protein CapA [Chloroflexi bacterium ADurb.Bin180]